MIKQGWNINTGTNNEKRVKVQMIHIQNWKHNIHYVFKLPTELEQGPKTLKQVFNM